MLNMKGAIGSPRRTPLFSLMHLPTTELIITLDDPGNTKNYIQLINFSGNPEALKHLSMNGHTMESNVLCISALNTVICCLCFVAALITS
jgi:hypothetical protein